jgi:hypothetical protein
MGKIMEKNDLHRARDDQASKGEGREDVREPLADTDRICRALSSPGAGEGNVH